MEITWGVGLKEKAESLVRKKQAERSAETTWEQQLAKRREKRKEAKLLKKQQKKQEQQNTAEQDDDDDIPSDVDMNDPYFREEFEGKDFQKVLCFLHLACSILILCLRRSLKRSALPPLRRLRMILQGSSCC